MDNELKDKTKEQQLAQLYMVKGQLITDIEINQHYLKLVNQKIVELKSVSEMPLNIKEEE